MVVVPEIIEPFDDSVLEGLSHGPVAHVILYVVEAALKFHASDVHVGYDPANHPDDGGKDEHTDHEVQNDKQKLPVGVGPWKLADGRQSQCGPVEAEQVLSREGSIHSGVAKLIGECGVDPSVVSKSHSLRY